VFFILVIYLLSK